MSDKLPLGLLAYSAIVRGDEPINPAFAFAIEAAGKFAEALDELRDESGEPLIAPETFAKLSEVNIFLLALSKAADDEVPTARNLDFPKRRGRPRKSIEKIGSYRIAAYKVLERAPLGYDAALIEVAKETGLDRTEIEAWVARIKADQFKFGLKDK